MSQHEIALILIGIALGWATKIPFFLHHYRKWERENAILQRQVEKLLEVQQ